MLVVVAGLEINATLRKLVALVVLAAAVKVETTLLVRPIKESLELQTPEVGVAVERITVLPYKQAVPAALVLSSSNTKFRLAPRSLPSNPQPSGLHLRVRSASTTSSLRVVVEAVVLLVAEQAQVDSVPAQA